MPTLPDIQAAAARLAPHLRRTPVLTLAGPELGLPGAVTLKLEFLQHTGSFKARGAFNRLLTAGPLEAGVAAASGGNHGAAVAYAARALGAKATIFVPAPTPQAKLDRIASYGADLVQSGANYAEAFEASHRWARARGALEVHAYDDEAVLAGQGTIGLELQQDAPALTHVLVAVGGGGLVGGIAAAHEGRPVQLLGVEPERSACLNAALEAGHPTPIEVGGVAADSLGARQVGQLSFDIARRTGLQSLLVPDSAITQAQSWLWDRLRIVAEPGGAAALAPILSGTYTPPEGSRLAIILCGANVSRETPKP